jgi:hypothetical protein
MRELDNSGALRRHEFHGEWNYTLVPPSQLRVLFINGYAIFPRRDVEDRVNLGRV